MKCTYECHSTQFGSMAADSVAPGVTIISASMALTCIACDSQPGLGSIPFFQFNSNSFTFNSNSNSNSFGMKNSNSKSFLSIPIPFYQFLFNSFLKAN